MEEGTVLGFISRRTCSLFSFAGNIYTLSFLESGLSPIHTSSQSRFSSHCILDNCTVACEILETQMPGLGPPVEFYSLGLP